MKGCPETVLKHVTSYRTQDGATEIAPEGEFTEETLAMISKDMAQIGLKPLSYAMKQMAIADF